MNNRVYDKRLLCDGDNEYGVEHLNNCVTHISCENHKDEEHYRPYKHSCYNYENYIPEKHEHHECQKYYKQEQCKCKIEHEHFDEAYGSFCSNESYYVRKGRKFSFNQAGVCGEGVRLKKSTEIEVFEAGIYYISYRVNVDMAPIADYQGTVNHRISIYVNNLQQPCSKAGHNLEMTYARTCQLINGDAIVYIPSCSKITLVNDSEEIGGSSIPVCDNGGNSVVLNIFKIK
ncbi:hypothetical protein [uncultured Clostridium sp.]|uniref:hypothetical protein n=1 Tax=uncultured Clostridium sp. TaxID=59620 RepID=UPI00261FD413|nr:hypothetical protein [uncultured Clostridium sp.]